MHTLPYTEIKKIIPSKSGVYEVAHKSGRSTTIHLHKQLVCQDTWRGVLMGLSGDCPPKLPPDKWETQLKLLSKKMEVSE